MQSAFKSGYTFSENDFKEAVINCDIKVVGYLYNIACCEITPPIIFSAIDHGKTDILNFFLKKITEYDDFEKAKCFDENIMKLLIIRDNNFKLAKKLYNLGCPPPKIDIDIILKPNGLEIIKWIHTNTCYRSMDKRCTLTEKICFHTPWNGDSVRFACIHNKLDIVIYLVENGCQFNEDLCMTVSKKYGNTEIMDYLDNIY